MYTVLIKYCIKCYIILSQNECRTTNLIHYTDSALVIVIKDGGIRGTKRC